MSFWCCWCWHLAHRDHTTHSKRALAPVVVWLSCSSGPPLFFPSLAWYVPVHIHKPTKPSLMARSTMNCASSTPIRRPAQLVLHKNICSRRENIMYLVSIQERREPAERASAAMDGASRSKKPKQRRQRQRPRLQCCDNKKMKKSYCKRS